jgi:hypothetical protein
VTTARTIIRNALTFGLNRLSPGEQEDPDLFGRCLDALGSIVDEMNGGGGMLWREVLTTSAPISGASAQLGVAWPGLASGSIILGATVQQGLGQDMPLDPITMGQYANIMDKASASLPCVFAHDGAETIYLHPAAAGQTITLRTKQAAQNFADLNTEYSMPAGYSSAFEALLAEKMADTLTGGISPKVARDAGRARLRLAAKTINPAMLGGGRSGDILTGWN